MATFLTLRAKSPGEFQLIYVATAYCFAAGIELIDSPIYLNCEFSLNFLGDQMDRMNFIMSLLPRNRENLVGAGYTFKISSLLEIINLEEKPIDFEVAEEIYQGYSHKLLQVAEESFAQQLIARIAQTTCQMLDSCTGLIADELRSPHTPMLFPVEVATLAQTRFISRPDHFKRLWFGPASYPFLIQYIREERHGKVGRWVQF